MMKRTLSAALLVLSGCFLSAEEKNVLPTVKWNVVKAGGAGGSVEKAGDGTVRLTRTGSQGTFWFYNGGHEYPVKPGKVYRIAAVYKSDVDGTIMLQVMGVKRTPFPIGRGKNGIAEAGFMARPGENKVRIHFSIPQGETLLEKIIVDEMEPPENIIKNPAVYWRASDLGGAKSTMEKIAGKYRIDKTADAGFTAFVPAADLDIVPGKNYLVKITVQRTESSVKYNLMFQMPGGKRTPFPTVNSIGTIGKPETLTYSFTAREDEKKLRPHVMIRGKGQIEILGVSVKEITDEELKAEAERKKVTAKSFQGDTLKRSWRPVSVVKEGDGSCPFVEFTAGPQGGLACEELSWKASEIKAVEVDFKAADEGGYLSCRFTSAENGKTYRSFCGVSVLPDGQWHRIMFPIGEDPAWRGTIKSMRFEWNGQTAPIGFGKIEATAKINRLHDLRPRGQYTLSHLHGNSPAELRFLDRHYREIGKVQLPAGKKTVDFTMPAMAMTCRVIPEDASLLAELKLLPKLDRPAAYWRGAWVWCWNGFGPDAENVWFRREIQLDAMPEEAQLEVAGDDSFTAYVNGHEAGSGSDWNHPGTFDIARHLKPGKNVIVIKVYNVQAWGGMLCELYAKVNGKAQYVVSDSSWNCHVGGKTEPAVFERPVMVLGTPPVAPWNNRVGYQYVGPKGKIRVLKAGENRFTAEVLEEVPLDSAKLTLKLTGPDGDRRITARISPSTSAWKKGKRIMVDISMPQQYSSASIFNDSDFLAVENQAKLGQVKVLPKKIPEMSTTRVTGSGMRPYFEINGRKYAPIYFLLSGGFGSDPATRDWMIRNARAAGCEIMRCGAAFAEFWKAEDLFDFSSIDRRLETIDFNAPGTKVILNVNAAMPQWWLKGNPDDMTAYFGGRPPHRQKDRQALASKKWLKDARVGLRGLIRHLQQSPYADRIIGIALSEGWNSEWFWSYTDDHQKSAMAGFSPADYATFRSYLKERYRMDEALRKAWNMPDVTLEKAPMPTDQQWKAGRVGILLDPQKDMQLIDWFRFRNRSIGEAITTLARYVKEESRGKWMVGAYYGYLLAFSSIYNRLQTVGHLDIERVARSLHVDFLTAPSFYTWRRSGQSDAIMQAAESFTAHGKLIIVEQDLRTFGETSSYEIRNGMLSTPEQSVGGLDRAIALSMTRGVGTHWLEMYENWFREPLLIQVMKEGKQAYEALGPVKGTTPVEVALVSDPESAMFIQLNAGNGLHVASIGEMQRRFAEAAVPFRQVLLRDLLEEKVVPPNKFYIVNNLVMLTESDRQALMERFKREKATVLWLYAAGVDTPDAGPSAEMMSDFLGIKFEMKNVVNRPVLKLKPGFRVKEAVNFNTTNPWFIPVSGFDEVLGTLSDGSPGLVKWQKDGVTHYFSTLMNLPPSLIQVLAERANVHVYAKGGDPVLAGNDVVALHAKSSGAKRILLPASCRMRAVLGPIKGEFSSGEVFEAKSGQTYVFQVYKSK